MIIGTKRREEVITGTYRYIHVTQPDIDNAHESDGAENPILASLGRTSRSADVKVGWFTCHIPSKNPGGPIRFQTTKRMRKFLRDFGNFKAVEPTSFRIKIFPF